MRYPYLVERVLGCVFLATTVTFMSLSLSTAWAQDDEMEFGDGVFATHELLKDLRGLAARSATAGA